MQCIKAFRVGTSNSKDKITIQDGKITGIPGDEFGIDISFGEQSHAEYYLGTKKSDPGAVLYEWDFPDDVYDLIVYRMKFPMVQGYPKGGKKSIWDVIKKLPAPINSTDLFVTRNNLIAPHFQREWLDLLEKYSRNKRVTVTTVEQAFPPEPVKVKLPDSQIGGEAVLFGDDGTQEDVQQMTKEEFITQDWAKAGYQFREA